MTTAHSPIHALRAQSDKIAAALKKAERGEKVSAAHGEKIEDARRSKDRLKFAVAMDDKILSIEMLWETIRQSTEKELSAYILKHMQEAREQ